jgi:hypothetical protein
MLKTLRAVSNSRRAPPKFTIHACHERTWLTAVNLSPDAFRADAVPQSLFSDIFHEKIPKKKIVYSETTPPALRSLAPNKNNMATQNQGPWGCTLEVPQRIRRLLVNQK